jgi:imidazolonepropionase-like amidohydrolase
MARRRTLGVLLVLFLGCPTASGGDHPIEVDANRIPTLQTDGTCLIRGAVIHSAVAPAFVGDVLVLDGDIAAVGDVDPALVPEGITVIDATGQHLVPGVVDCHSHIAIDRGVNEGTVSISAEVTIKDVVNPDRIAIWRALAGGVTTIRQLHGSANAIGGRDEILKLRWNRQADDLRFPEAPQGIKFALGENPKRSNWGKRGSRFPGTRMGVEAIYYRAFERAREYAKTWEAYFSAQALGEDPPPPRRDLRLEVLQGILEGNVHVHSHCYRADEILMLIRTSQHFGFQIATLQHVLEGYKVAFEMAEADVGGSTFSDWWSYKIEAYDAIPQNAALMAEAGVLSSVNSDSGELMRRMYGEAAKSVRYGGMDPIEALCLVTLNPALQLGIGDRVGSIEVGKDADLVLMNGDPLSSLARVERTLVDGRVEFERRDAFGLNESPGEVAEVILEVVEPPQTVEGSPRLALIGATVHPIAGPDIPDGTVLVSGEHIVAVGKDVPIPAGTEVVDMTGLHIWPGMVALNTGLGIREIDSIAATMDESEMGGNQPDLRVAASIHAASAHFGVTRHNGVTRAQTAPQGGGPIMGQSAVIDLDGETWEDLVTDDRDMLHIAYPRTSNGAEDIEDAEEGEEVDELKDLFERAREHGRLLDEAAAGAPPPPFDPRLAALVPYARGEKTVALHANNAQTILFALRFAKEQELSAVLYGVREGWKVVDALAASGLAVVVGPVLALPSDRFDPYDAAYANAAVLQRAGVPFAIMSDDEENPRNLAFHAAMACAFGLPREEALRAITLYPATILGLVDEIGSLSPGRRADLVVTDGDLLEITTRVIHLYIDGVPVDLSNRQTRFYERYRARLGRLQGR